MQLTITLSKDTPLEVLLETSEYISTIAAILHNEPCDEPASVRIAKALAPTPANNVVPFAPPAPTPAPAPVFTGNIEHDPLEVDVDGYPWDGRIHAAGRGKTSTGQWRKRRHTRDERVAQVEAELRNKLAERASRAPAEVRPAPLAVPAPTADDVPLPPEPSILLVQAPIAPPPPPAPVAVALPPVPAPAPAPAPATAAITERSLDEVLALVTDVLVGDLLVEEDVQQILTQFELKELADLAGRSPAMVALVYDAIEKAAK